VLQLRLKGPPTREVIEAGAPYRDLCRTADVAFFVNDDVDAALALGADGVHLGRDDLGAERALNGGLALGLSASTPEEVADAAERGASYVGAGPVWSTPTKPDAGPPLGLDGLAAVCRAASVPVIAIGGIDEHNAADCVAAGAAGVAVVRAAARAHAVREAIDAAVRAR
jgi:thiamine-phosphate pyrophosphorylase